MNLLIKRNEIITYTVNKNITNDLCVSVQNGEVVVHAPWYFSKNQIKEIVVEKRRWIIEKLKEYETRKGEYVSGGIVKILGRGCYVKIKYRNIKAPNINIENREIKIELPSMYKKTNKEEILNLLTQKIYNLIAQREIEKAMEKTRIILGYAPEDYKIERMPNILGKCSESKTITINPDIVKYSQYVIDYVVLHEFAHLKYKTHSKKFYEIIKQNMKDYEKYEEEIIGLKY